MKADRYHLQINTVLHRKAGAVEFLLRKLEKQQKKGEQELVSTESRFDQKSYGRHQTNT